MRRLTNPPLTVVALLLVATPAWAKKKPSGDASTPAASREAEVTETVEAETGLIRQEVDLDGNGRTDVYNTLRDRGGGVRVAVEKKVDLNFDGKIDVISEFDEDGALTTERMDGDFDGKIDWIDHYKDNLRVMAELDTNFDERSDVWLYYVVDASGVSRIDRKERDTNGDGRVDVWERFDAAGNVIRTGRDNDGDGRMDERDQ